MNRLSTVFGYSSLSILFLLTSCFDDDNGVSSCVQVEGQIVSETRVVDDFHSILLQGVANVLLIQGATQSLRIETHEGVLDIVETTVANEVLSIDLSTCLEGSLNRLDVFMTVPDIKRLELVGVGTITMQNDFNPEELIIRVSGVGDINAMGATDFLEVNTSGAGNVNAFEMIAETCDVFLSGTGNVEVTVTSELNVVIDGAGNVSYKGQPTINEDIEGLGRLIDAN